MITIKSNHSAPALQSPLRETKPATPGKIFVTGAENTLASVLTYGLYEHGAQLSVQTVQHDAAVALKRNFPVQHCSLADERFADALASFAPDVILHAPAEPSREPSSHWPRASFNRIVEKTLAVCEAARRHSPAARVMLLSSADVYGECASAVAEDHVLAPITMQGRYMRMAEQILQDFNEAHGLNTTILRVSSAYGPSLRNNPVNALLFNLLGPRGTNGRVGMNMHATRDLIHSGDVLQAVKLILAKTTGGVFNIASGTCLTLTELNTHLCAVLEMAQAPLASAPVANETLSQRLDIGKLRSLGFQPEVPLIEGLRGYAAWWSGAKAA